MAGKQMTQKQLEKRERILNAAIHLFAQNGYASTPVANIAKAAEVSFGTVFTYFGDKETLFAAAISEPLPEFEDWLIHLPITDKPVIEQLNDIIAEQFKPRRGTRDYLQLVQQVLGQPKRHESLFGVLDEWFSRLRQALIPLIEEGQHRGELAVQSADLVAITYFSYFVGTHLTMAETLYAQLWQQFSEQALQLFRPLPPQR